MDCGVISDVCPQELEQGRYELRLKLDDCQAQWESQVSELERDVQELQAQVQRLSQSLSEAEREKSRLKHEHSEQSQRLGEQLQRVSDTYCTSHQPLFSSIAFIMTQHGPWVLIPRVTHCRHKITARCSLRPTTSTLTHIRLVNTRLHDIMMNCIKSRFLCLTIYTCTRLQYLHW